MADNNIKKAVSKAIESAPDRNFTESIDLAVNLRDIDLSNPENRVDMEIVLPNGRGKEIKIGVFGSGELALQAKKKADTVIEPEDIDSIADDTKEAKELAEEHDFFLAEPPLMPVIGRSLGAVLGPKGKMPSPITPDKDLGETVDSLKNTVHVRSKDRRTFHTPVGTLNMDIDEVSENIDTVIKRLISGLERREMNIDGIYVKTTMGPAVKIM